MEFKSSLTSCNFIRHKYGGCNFQIIFTKIKDDVEIRFANGDRILEEDEDFNQYRSIIKDSEHEEFFENIKQFLKMSKYTTINLYGEIYGEIQKRIKYLTLYLIVYIVMMLVFL